MPVANKGFGCPATKKIFFRSNSCQEFLLTTFYLVISQNFTQIFLVISASYLSKILTTFFSRFSQFLLFLSLFFLTSFRMPTLSCMPGAVLHFFTFYAFTLTFSTFAYAFFQKNPSLDAPAWMPGMAAPRTSSARHCWNVFGLLLI